MTNINTVKNTDKTVKVDVSFNTEFSIGQGSFKKQDLEAWLSRLPDNARIKFNGIASGNIRLLAHWKEMR